MIIDVYEGTTLDPQFWSRNWKENTHTINKGKLRLHSAFNWGHPDPSSLRELFNMLTYYPIKLFYAWIFGLQIQPFKIFIVITNKILKFYYIGLDLMSLCPTSISLDLSIGYPKCSLLVIVNIYHIYKNVIFKNCICSENIKL